MKKCILQINEDIQGPDIVNFFRESNLKCRGRKLASLLGKFYSLSHIPAEKAVLYYLYSRFPLRMQTTAGFG